MKNNFSSSVTVRPIETAREWRNLLRLYKRAFPRSERKPPIILLNCWRRKKADVWYAEKTLDCGHGERKCFLGFAITLNGTDAVMLDYLAVADHARGKGAGSFILKTLLNAYNDKGFFTEIESIYEKDIPNLYEREKRRGFYIKNGLLPLYVTADVFGVQMELMGVNMNIDFAGYNAFYQHNYSSYAAKHVTYVEPSEHFPKKGLF